MGYDKKAKDLDWSVASFSSQVKYSIKGRKNVSGNGIIFILRSSVYN